MPPPSPRPRSSTALRSIATGHGAAVVLAVLGAVLATHPSATTALALVVGALAGMGAYLRRHPALAPLGALVAGAGLALIGVTPPGAITILGGVLLGAGVGLALPGGDVDRRLGAIGGAAAVGELALVALLVGRTAAMRWGFVLVVGAAVVAVAERTVEHRPRRGGVLTTVVACALAVGMLAWVGGNDPTVEWFGHITTHGDRHGDEVALTFDDGPDSQYSMEVAHILDEHGVKGTFFEVGKAIDARPDITQALDADGHLLGNHSYRHDYTGWLDPRYPELAETQGAFRRALGRCPALFRPPHGQRTPFMLARVGDEGMHTVTWDVSAKDWVEHDGHVVAQRILAGVRPGSIILLHDGLDGNVTSDRSVLEAALPEILDGLAAKGLHPVRLDELLGVQPYLDHC